LSTPPDRTRFRSTMGRWATGVAVVTSRDGTVDAGLTVNAFLSVSLFPPTVLVSLQDDVDTLPVVERSRTFAVNLLAADQQAVSERFARAVPPAEKFRDLAFHRGTTGAALLDGTLGALECRVLTISPAFDHRLVLGEVVELEAGRDAAPLLVYRGGYAVEAGEDGLRLPPPRHRSETP
jgi:flavin reductase (DIM6/NTAB) family NADH-FMN oxidoreductase RutF